MSTAITLGFPCATAITRSASAQGSKGLPLKVVVQSSLFMATTTMSCKAMGALNRSQRSNRNSEKPRKLPTVLRTNASAPTESSAREALCHLKCRRKEPSQSKDGLRRNRDL